MWGEQNEDILESRRNQSDLRWAAQEWKADSVYKYAKDIDKKALIQKIKNSERVQLVISKLSQNEDHSSNHYNKKVEKILQEMAHSFDISTIRKFAVILPKVMKSIYGKIYVNHSGIQKLKMNLEETPVILLPTHRSYADFLLISYLSFHYNLPFPVIAAGMDFMSMAVIGNMLREAGAFYIKRSFMNDELYSAVFHEYVQAIFCYSGHPMEFFLEGTRSRSGKSLSPKIGLLSCVTECWLRAKVPDIFIVPISISYNRTLEETLYAYELLGVPKPKESTSGLFKAMSILNENFGNIYVHFGDAISASEFMAPRVHRYMTTGSPLHLTSVTKQELNACEDMSLRVLRQLQKNCVVSVWSLSCVVFFRLLWQNLISISFESLLDYVSILVDAACQMGASVECYNDKELMIDDLHRSIYLHRNIVNFNEFDEVEIYNAFTEKVTDTTKGIGLSEETRNEAILHLHIQHYTNQCLHVFIRPFLLLHALSSNFSDNTMDMVRSKYFLLSRIFSQDFIFEYGKEEKDFHETLAFLSNNILVTIDQNNIVINYAENSLTDIIIQLFSPFVVCYLKAVELAGSRKMWTCPNEFAGELQKALEQTVTTNRRFSSLSLDTCKNAFKMLIKLNALQRKKETDVAYFVPDVDQLQIFRSVLSNHYDSLQSKL